MRRRLSLGSTLLPRTPGRCHLCSTIPKYMCPHLHTVYMAFLHTLPPYLLTSHLNTTLILHKAHGNGATGTIRSHNRSIPITALRRVDPLGGFHKSHHKRRNMESVLANRQYNTETKSVHRHSIMDGRSRSRPLHMAAGSKNRQGFMAGKHQWLDLNTVVATTPGRPGITRHVPQPAPQ